MAALAWSKASDPDKFAKDVRVGKHMRFVSGGGDSRRALVAALVLFSGLSFGTRKRGRAESHEYRNPNFQAGQEPARWIKSPARIAALAIATAIAPCRRSPPFQIAITPETIAERPPR